MPKPLWVCPKCGAKLLVRNLSHACGPYTVDAFLARHGPTGRALFERFVSLVRQCGPFDFAPAKTRVAFMARTRFASVNRLSDGGMSFHIVLARRIASPRFARVERVARWHVHHLRVTRPADLDDEVLGWLRESYVEMGRGRPGGA